LFDIVKDSGEQKNLVNEKEEIALELKKKIDDWYHKTVIEDGHPKHQNIIVDLQHENPVELTRNDARGYPEIWVKDKVYAYWDVEFVEDGYYDFTFQFREAPGMKGNIILKMAPIQYFVKNDDPNATMIKMKNCYIPKGRNNLELYYHVGFNEIIAPFSVLIQKSTSE
jgi:hypothetical protein